MSKRHKELYIHQKRSVKNSQKDARVQKKTLNQQRKMFAARRQQRKDYPMLHKRTKEEQKDVAVAEPNKRNVASKRREIQKTLNW